MKWGRRLTPGFLAKLIESPRMEMLVEESRWIVRKKPPNQSVATLAHMRPDFLVKLFSGVLT